MLLDVLLLLRNFLYRDMKCGIICLSHAAQLPVLNGRKHSPIFHESSAILFNISYLGYYKFINFELISVGELLRRTSIISKVRIQNSLQFLSAKTIELSMGLYPSKMMVIAIA